MVQKEINPNDVFNPAMVRAGLAVLKSTQAKALSESEPVKAIYLSMKKRD